MMDTLEEVATFQCLCLRTTFMQDVELVSAYLKVDHNIVNVSLQENVEANAEKDVELVSS